MRNLYYLACVALLLGSCKKLDDFSVPGKTVPENRAAVVENLGHVFSGTNVTWKIHPLDPSNKPLFTFLPNQNSGYCMLMIDNGNLNGLTPINAFRFVAVNLQNNTSKIITVKDANGNPANYSLGRVVRYLFGLDKKFYVATEGSPDGGGHLVQYDPNTQTATDLGKPFKKGGKYLDIYSLNVGTDGALYGGSFGGEGDVMTFRYADNKFYVDAAPLDNVSRYVTAVSGDSRFTYAVCGKNNWALYATDRQTGEKKVLKSNPGSNISIDIASHQDAPYAHSVATHYKLTGFSCAALKEFYTPSTARVSYNPYPAADEKAPQVQWNDVTKKVDYTLTNGQAGSVNVFGLQEDVYPAGPLMFFNNRVYVASSKQGLLGSYTAGAGFEAIGRTSMTIQTMLAPASGTNDNNLFLAGYPKGGLLQYSTAQDWTVNIAGYSNKNGGFATPSSNPRQSAMFQNADATGINGSMSLLGIGYTEDGTIATAGNNDRITQSSGRELSMGTYKNGIVKNLFMPEFANFEFQSFCMSKDRRDAFIGALPHSGNDGRLYKYNAATNTITMSWNLALWGDRKFSLKVLDANTLVGICDDTIFLFDLVSGSIVWKQALGQGQKIYAMEVAADQSVYINHVYRGATNFKIVKYNFNISSQADIKAQATDVAQFADRDNDEKNKPVHMMIAPGYSANSGLYISGLTSIYRVRI